MSFIDKFRQLPTPLMITHVSSKFCFGVGLGVLLSGYLKGYGWWIILGSLVLGIPSTMSILSVREFFARMKQKSAERKKAGGEGTVSIYVGNLPRGTGDKELRELFEPFGNVMSGKIIRDRVTGNPRGFGFVEMSEGEAGAAITSMNGREFNGRKIRVNLARAKEDRGRNRRRR